MRTFNFYVNVDQCLNMSNFDMFFYRLQSENRFHLSNVQFYDDSGNNSLKKTFNEIRDYMDNTSIPIGDYRIVFGMRAHRKEKPRWEETLLYRMIKIHYALLFTEYVVVEVYTHGIWLK